MVVAKLFRLSFVMVFIVMVMYGVIVYLVCRVYYERKIDDISSRYEQEVLRRAHYEREYLDTVIMFIRESDSTRYWERVRREIEYSKQVANGER